MIGSGPRRPAGAPGRPADCAGPAGEAVDAPAAAPASMLLAVLAADPGPVTRALRPVPPGVTLVGGAESAAISGLDRADALFSWGKPHEPFEQVLARAPRLRWVHSTGAGIEHLLVPELLARPIVVTNSRGLYTDSIAEYGLALMLAHAKRLPPLVLAQSERRWAPGPTRDLGGATLLVVGLGSVGSALARRARALGMRVLAVRRGGRPAPRLAERVYTPGELERALPEAVYLALCCPDTPETRGLIGRRALGLLPAGAFVVNLARGSAIDEPALIDALRSGRLGGAGLDVYSAEPLPPESPLWTLPGVIVSPHQAPNAVGWDARALALMRENLARFLAGRRLRNVVRTRRGY
jgi:phosphoglycerate dehydrogenase-like enzyme